MMRRGLWLAVGAVLGVAGYRRATRLVDDLVRGGSRGAVAPGEHSGSRGVVPLGEHRGGSGGLATVRLPAAGRRDSAGQPAPGRPVSTAARIAATAGFVRDVHDGMAEYLELHHRELARNLGSRSNRTSSG